MCVSYEFSDEIVIKTGPHHNSVINTTVVIWQTLTTMVLADSVRVVETTDISLQPNLFVLRITMIDNNCNKIDNYNPITYYIIFCISQDIKLVFLMNNSGFITQRSISYTTKSGILTCQFPYKNIRWWFGSWCGGFSIKLFVLSTYGGLIANCYHWLC